MKVFQINAVNNIGSTGRNCFELSDYLNKNGHECVTAFSKGPSVDTYHEYRIGRNVDTKIHALLSRLSGKQGYYSYFATRKLLDFANNFKPDIVVLNNLHGNYINLKLLLKYLAKNDIPTVAVLHDCWFFTGKCCHYTVDGCYKWKDNCGKCPSLKKYNKSWFFDKTKLMITDKKKLFSAIPRLAVVGVSDWLTNEAKQAPVFENAKIVKRIYNWIDTDIFCEKNAEKLREDLGLVGKKVLLSVASNWNKEKGIETILEISKKLQENERILLVGNLKCDAKLSDNIIHVSSTNSAQKLAQYYSLADVFFQPSLEETFGKVSAEALACGTPIVCFNSTANPELVGENCGAFVNVGDIEGLLNNVRTIFSSNKENFKTNCSIFAKNNFSKCKQLEKYLNLFKELTNEN